MALDKSSTGFGDLYGWLCCRITELSNDSNRQLKLHVLPSGKMFTLRTHSTEKSLFLYLWLDSEDSGESVYLGDIGTCRIEEYREEEMQQNFLPLFSSLCLFVFLGVTHNDIMELSLRPSDIRADTIEASTYGQAFNTLFSAACYIHLICQIKQCSPESALKELGDQETKEMLKIIGPAATERLMKYLATELTKIRLQYGNASVGQFQMSYSSSLAGDLTIRSYCPRLSMSTPTTHHKNKDNDLHLALSYHMLQFMFHFCHEVDLDPGSIKVKLMLKNLRCKASKLDSPQPIRSKVAKEWYFPVKVAVTTGPENKSGVHVLSFSASSQNPEMNISKAKTTEVRFQAEQVLTIGLQPELGSKINVGLKDSCTNGYSYKHKNWLFELFEANCLEGRLQWTLHDNFYSKPVFSYKPPKFSFWSSKDKYFEAFKALAQGAGSERPFTEEGGVEFGEDMYGIPLIWKLSRELEGQTLRFFVEVEIWLAYYPNQYCTDYMEIIHHKFREPVELPLVKSVHRSSLHPTSVNRDIGPHRSHNLMLDPTCQAKVL